jgi:hypothetical protein
MLTYLSFGEVASRLGCETKKVRQLVLEDKSLRATRITPNGLVLSKCGLNGHFPYDLDFNSHLSGDGEITCDTYRLNAIGETEKTQTLFVGYLRVESAELQRFLSEQTPLTHDDDMLDAAALARLVARATDAVPAPASLQPPSGAQEQRQAKVVKHTTKGQRAHWLDAVLKTVRNQAADPNDCMSVWYSLCGLARSDSPPEPLMGMVGKSIKRRDGSNHELFDYNAFAKYWERREGPRNAA